jgi:hypothetical protein
MIVKNKRLIILISSITLGLVAGFLYWKFIGCSTGTCPITSNWHMSTLFGGVFGYLISDSFVTKNKKEPAVNKGGDIKT